MNLQSNVLTLEKDDFRNEGQELKIIKGRNLLRSKFASNAYISDLTKGLPHPPITKEAVSTNIIKLKSDFDENDFNENDYYSIVKTRRSQRIFDENNISLDQLAFLLWSTQGIVKLSRKLTSSLRTVPSAGARHPFETYLLINNVEGLEPGLYHYLPIESSIERIKNIDNFSNIIKETINQSWANKSSVVFFWTACIYRMEYRYSIDAHKLILLDAGHVGQNLSLSAESLNLGSCCIASYNQDKCDDFIGINGTDESTVYIAAIGNVKKK